MKKELRKEIKNKISELTLEEKQEISEKVFLEIEQLPEFKNANYILFFWSLPDEVITHSFITKWSKTKHVLLPVVQADELSLKCFDNNNLQTGHFGIQEPTGSFFTDFDKIDLILVPGVAFSPEGNRLGRGKGYYDKLLPKLSGIKIGVCFPCQLVDTIPLEKWDAKVDRVICGSLKNPDER